MREKICSQRYVDPRTVSNASAVFLRQLSWTSLVKISRRWRHTSATSGQLQRSNHLIHLETEGQHQCYSKESPSVKTVKKVWGIQQRFAAFLWRSSGEHPYLCNNCLVWEHVCRRGKAAEQGGAYCIKNHQVCGPISSINLLGQAARERPKDSKRSLPPTLLPL